jgi:hypothetical protein
MFYDNPTNPFQGWSIVTLGCAAVGALGGVLVALSIKCAACISTRVGLGLLWDLHWSPSQERSPLPPSLVHQLAPFAALFMRCFTYRCPLPLLRRYTDSIMKTIATTGSIVLTTVLNGAFMGGPFTLPIWSGGLIVVVSVFNYNDSGDPSR